MQPLKFLKNFLNKKLHSFPSKPLYVLLYTVSINIIILYIKEFENLSVEKFQTQLINLKLLYYNITIVIVYFVNILKKFYC